MSLGFRDRLAYWLERRLPALVLRADGVTPHTGRPRLVNRLNGHVVIR